MNRIDRLFAILLRMQSTAVIRAGDLAAQFAVSERTIYRDMRALNEMGVPIATLPGEGYALLDTFRLPPVMLTPEEATALFLAGRMLTRIGTGHIAIHAESALQKVAAVLPTDARAHVEHLAQMIDFFPSNSRLNWDEPHLLHIIGAIESRHTLHLTYRAYQEAAVTERDVDPYHITFADGVWYVNGYCHLRRDMRSFRLNRILTLEVTAKPFERRLIVPERAETLTITVRFNPTILPHVRERQHYAFVAEADDHTMTYRVHTLDEIRNWLLGFGAMVEAVTPDVLRHWLRDEAQRLINNLT